MVRVRPAQLTAEHLSLGRRANRPSGALLNIPVFYSCWAYICLYSWWAYSPPSLALRKKIAGHFGLLLFLTSTPEFRPLLGLIFFS